MTKLESRYNVLIFKCPHCGHNRLEEVMSNVTVSTLVGNITIGKYEEGELHHCYDGTSRNRDGENDHYQCYDCGYVLEFVGPDGLDWPVIDKEDLLTWFEQNKG